MRILFFALAILLITLSCITSRVEVKENIQRGYIEPDVIPILEEFEYQARLRGLSFDRKYLTIHFNYLFDEPERVVGYCTVSKNSPYHYIALRAKTWEKFSYEEREELLFHELAHGLLNRDHCTAEDNDGNPVSIMYPRMFDSISYYSNHREDLIDELFIVDSRCTSNYDPLNAGNGPLRPPSHSDPKR